MKSKENFSFFVAVSVLVGTCIGAGVLGIPYVAAQAGFLLTLGYILIIGLVILFVNLYLGEVALRTKEDHQLVGYAEKYLGKTGKHIIEFAAVFGLFAALTAYMLGIGESISFLFFGDGSYSFWFGIIFGILMAFLIKGEIKSLKKFEKIGVIIILFLLIVIFSFFVMKINTANLLTYNSLNLFLPFGVVLFALMSFHAIPQVKLVLKKKEKLFKKTMITGTLVSIIFYIIFTFIVVGFKGAETPQVATLVLGTFFICLGIFTMFTSYLSGGIALIENFIFDERWNKNWAWFLASVVPIGIFILTHFTNFFSFTNILSLGGIISGGILAIAVLFMVKKSKKKGNRKPEYSLPLKWGVIIVLSLIFLFGAIREILIIFR